MPEGGKRVEDGELDALPQQVLRSLRSLSKNSPYTITKSGGAYYILFLERVEPAKVKSFEEAKGGG
ncbi:MAG: hypothetical protein Q9N34_08835 [Aquificota bacterium]|nr:hypothetical protein [Aquificota bacterium]